MAKQAKDERVVVGFNYDLLEGPVAERVERRTLRLHLYHGEDDVPTNWPAIEELCARHRVTVSWELCE